MSDARRLGGVIHTYQKYDPINIPSPSSPPPDAVSAGFEHLLNYGDMRHFTDEELAKMVKIDPRQIQGFMASLDSIRQQLLERKRKILETYETQHAQQQAAEGFAHQAKATHPPKELARDYHRAVREEQLHDLEELFYRARDDRSPFARGLVQLAERLAEKYQIEELAAKYEFTGQEKMDVPKALEIKAELEEIDKLLKQLDEVEQSGQLGYLDVEDLEEFIDSEGMENLRQMQQWIDEYTRQAAENQGMERDASGQWQMTPKAYRLFQSKILSTIFNELQASRTGRHQEAVLGEGATESPATKEYEFGDSVAHMDIPGSLINAMLRTGGASLPVRMQAEDIVVHKTRNTPKAATCVLLDMSGSMRYGGLYANVKRMGLALDGLIRSEYPGDFLQFIEMYTFAKPRHISEIAGLMPKPVTIHNSVVRLKADLSNPKISEFDVPWHFTNIQHALQTARRYLSVRDTPNRQVMLITDGLPTAHFEGSTLYLLYPPDPRTEEATMREALLCARDGITINIFLLSSWSQSEEDIRFAYRMAEATKGRVVFSTGRELDRYVIWDYIKRRKTIVG